MAPFHTHSMEKAVNQQKMPVCLLLWEPKVSSDSGKPWLWSASVKYTIQSYNTFTINATRAQLVRPHTFVVLDDGDLLSFQCAQIIDPPLGVTLERIVDSVTNGSDGHRIARVLVICETSKIAMPVSRQIEGGSSLPSDEPWKSWLQKGSDLQHIPEMPTAEAISLAEKNGDRFVGLYPVKTYEEARRHELIEKIPGLVADVATLKQDMAEVKRLVQKQTESIELLMEEVNRKKRKRAEKEKFAMEESARKRAALAASPAFDEPKAPFSTPVAMVMSEATAAAVNAALAVVVKHSTVSADQ